MGSWPRATSTRARTSAIGLRPQRYGPSVGTNEFPVLLAVDEQVHQDPGQDRRPKREQGEDQPVEAFLNPRRVKFVSDGAQKAI